MKVMAVDPGVTTGIAVWESKWPGWRAESFSARQVDEQLAAAEIVRSWVDPPGPPRLDVLVCESFRLSAGTVKKSQAGSLVTIELIGMLRWLAHRANVPFVLQSPADAEAFSTNDKLNLLGWWTPGLEHARSATRHLVLYLVRTGCIDTQRVIGSVEEGGSGADS